MNVLRALTGLAIVALILGGGGVDQAAAQCGNLVLDANIANFANCTIIAGELYFDGSSGQLTITEIDLANFGNLQEITMTLYITNNPSLVSIVGLSNLTSIGSLVVDNNPNLGSLAPLSGISSLTSSLMPGQRGLQIIDSPGLMSLEGLENVTEIGAMLEVTFNDNLADISALGNVTSVAGDLLIKTNGFLTSLTGLDAITTVGGDLEITYSPVTSLAPLSALTSVGGSILSVTHADITSFDGLSQLSGGAGLQVSIRNNGLLQDLDGLAGLTTPASMILTDLPALEDLSGLAGLTNLGDTLRVDSADRLTTLDSLAALTSVNILLIRNNENLTDASALFDDLENAVQLDVTGNPVLGSVELINIDGYMSSVSITNNDAITKVDLAQVSTVGTLTITGNAALTEICMFDLAAATGLVVENNGAGACSVPASAGLEDIDTGATVDSMSACAAGICTQITTTAPPTTLPPDGTGSGSDSGNGTSTTVSSAAVATVPRLTAGTLACAFAAAAALLAILA